MSFGQCFPVSVRLSVYEYDFVLMRACALVYFHAFMSVCMFVGLSQCVSSARVSVYVTENLERFGKIGRNLTLT